MRTHEPSSRFTIFPVTKWMRLTIATSFVEAAVLGIVAPVAHAGPGWRYTIRAAIQRIGEPHALMRDGRHLSFAEARAAGWQIASREVYATCIGLRSLVALPYPKPNGSEE
jgi:hypothetical protein